MGYSFSQVTENIFLQKILTGVRKSENVVKVLGLKNGHSSLCVQRRRGIIHVNGAYSLLRSKAQSKNSLHWTVYLSPFRIKQSVRDKTADVNSLNPDKEGKGERERLGSRLN